MRLRELLAYEPVELSFGTSGLRALVTDMTDLECYINATGFLRFLAQKDGLEPGDTVYLAGDLRDSTPRILRVMVAAIKASGFVVEYCGKIPTPAIAYYALINNAPCIMVTGSHIPADRNGIKFYKTGIEVLKADEADMQSYVQQVRGEIYNGEANETVFSNEGTLVNLPELPPENNAAEKSFFERYTSLFDASSLVGKQIVVYQHSAVGRDLLVRLLEALGASVVPVGRSDTFVSIDTENVTEIEKTYFKNLSREFPDVFAIVSTDGDSDRPFVIDEDGIFYRGDVLGCVVTSFLGAKFAGVPISSNDAIGEYCAANGITAAYTKIGSPYVIVAMQAADAALTPKVGWEVNGGYLTGDDIKLQNGILRALPTRDAILPILASILLAAQQNIAVSEVFAHLPKRYTGGGLIDDVDADKIASFRTQSSDEVRMKELATTVFSKTDLGIVARIDTTDGLRIIFESGEVVHLRPSGNAPQFRVYSNANTQERADELATNAVAPNGYIEQLLNTL